MQIPAGGSFGPEQKARYLRDLRTPRHAAAETAPSKRPGCGEEGKIHGGGRLDAVGTIGRIFVSYALSDREIADRVVGRLTSAGLNVWIDRAQIAPGQSIVQRISEALADSSYLLLLASPASLASNWVSREWASSLAAKNTAIVPLKIAPVDMPRLLLDTLYIDLTANFEAGMDQLIEFFHRESEPAVRPVKGSKSRALLAGASRYEIRRVTHGCIDEPTFRAYLFELEIDPGSIGGDSLHEKVMSLVHRMDSEGMVKGLLKCLERDRSACVKTQLDRARVDQARVDALEF